MTERLERYVNCSTVCPQSAVLGLTGCWSGKTWKAPLVTKHLPAVPTAPAISAPERHTIARLRPAHVLRAHTTPWRSREAYARPLTLKFAPMEQSPSGPLRRVGGDMRVSDGARRAERAPTSRLGAKPDSAAATGETPLRLSFRRVYL